MHLLGLRADRQLADVVVFPDELERTKHTQVECGDPRLKLKPEFEEQVENTKALGCDLYQHPWPATVPIELLGDR